MGIQEDQQQYEEEGELDDYDIWYFQLNNINLFMSFISTTHKAYILQIFSSLCIVVNQLNIRILAKDFSPSMILSVRAGLLFLLNFIFIFR